MENFLDIMKEYGSVTADLAAARKDLAQLQRELEQAQAKVQDLELQKHKLEGEAIVKDANLKTLQEMNTEFVRWLTKVLDYCNMNKISIQLPEPPPCLPTSITNNFNGSVGMQVASAGCVVGDMPPKDDKTQSNTDNPDNNKQS